MGLVMVLVMVQLLFYCFKTAIYVEVGEDKKVGIVSHMTVEEAQTKLRTLFNLKNGAITANGLLCVDQNRLGDLKGRLKFEYYGKTIYIVIYYTYININIMCRIVCSKVCVCFNIRYLVRPAVY